jgi:hypothetical protein
MWIYWIHVIFFKTHLKRQILFLILHTGTWFFFVKMVNWNQIYVTLMSLILARERQISKRAQRFSFFIGKFKIVFSFRIKISTVFVVSSPLIMWYISHGWNYLYKNEVNWISASTEIGRRITHAFQITRSDVLCDRKKHYHSITDIRVNTHSSRIKMNTEMNSIGVMVYAFHSILNPFVKEILANLISANRTNGS